MIPIEDICPIPRFMECFWVHESDSVGIFKVILQYTLFEGLGYLLPRRMPLLRLSPMVSHGFIVLEYP